MSTHKTEDKGPQVNAVSYAFLVLSTIAVVLRLCGRLVAHKAEFWWDDWLSLASLPFVWAMCGTALYWVSVGFGKHLDQIPGSYSELAKPLFIMPLIYNTGFTMIRMSVLLSYVRIFRIVLLYRLVFWIVAILIISWGITINIMAIFECTPIHKAWDSTIPGHCLSFSKAFLGTAITNVVIDLILLVLPMPMLWKLHIELSNKIALIVVFSAGYCVPILSVMRLTSTVDVGNEKDPLWTGVYPMMLVTSELSIALISSCMPATFTLIKHGIRNCMPNLSGTPGNLEPLGQPAGAQIEVLRNPIEENKHKGFIQLASGRGDTEGSIERLFDGTRGTVHYTNAYPGQIGDRKEVDEEGGIPLHRIHVRDDVHVHGSSGTNGIERSADQTVLNLGTRKGNMEV